jgi:hypothetical protein
LCVVRNKLWSNIAKDLRADNNTQTFERVCLVKKYRLEGRKDATNVIYTKIFHDEVKDIEISSTYLK